MTRTFSFPVVLFGHQLLLEGFGCYIFVNDQHSHAIIMNTTKHFASTRLYLYKITSTILISSAILSCTGHYAKFGSVDENVLVKDFDSVYITDCNSFYELLLSRIAAQFDDDAKYWSIIEEKAIKSNVNDNKRNIYVCYNEKDDITAVVYNTLQRIILLIQSDGKLTFDELDEKCNRVYSSRLNTFLSSINEDELLPEELVFFDFSANQEILLTKPIIPDPDSITFPEGYPASPFQLIFHTNETVSSNTHGPLCHVLWEQQDSFNQRIEPIYCEQHGWVIPPAGCGPIAVGQALTVLQPDYIDFGDTIWTGDWDAITEVVNWSILDDVRNQELGLISLLGRALHTNYHCGGCTNGSSTNITNIVSFYRESLGYTNSYVDSYNYTSVVNELSVGRPVVALGYDSDIDVGHFWLIHGSETITRVCSERIYECLVEQPSSPINLSEWRLVSDNTSTTYIGDYVTCNYGYGGADIINNSGIFEVADLLHNTLRFNNYLQMIRTNQNNN